MPRYHVDRSIDIEVPAIDVFNMIADYTTWRIWSPWLCAEPDAQVIVSSDSSSVGSTYAWKGEVTGEGQLEHKQLETGRLIVDEIRFFKPFRSQSQVSFQFEPVSNGTRVTWNMDGSLPWFMFWMKSILVAMIGMDYERGLKMLREYIETGTILSQTNIIGVETIEPLRMAGVRRQCAVADVSQAMQKAFDEAHEVFRQHGLPTDGEMITVYHKFDMRAQTFDYTSGYVVAESAGAIPASISQWSTPTTKAFHIEHIGSYEHLGNAWGAAHQITRYKKLRPCSTGAFEIYRNSPETTSEAELHTDIYLALR